MLEKLQRDENLEDSISTHDRDDGRGKISISMVLLINVCP
jgi:hypothetical protein